MDERGERLLLANVLVVATCALVYELLCGTLASYLLGDAVLQFALVLGIYLFAMGVGAWVSKRLEPSAPKRYVQAEIALALVGGLSAPALLLAFAAHVPLRPALYATVFAIGALVGLELPLLVHILRSRKTEGASASRFGDVVARALSFDYVGALAASILFPIVLVPHLGLVRTSVLTGALNVAAALSATFVLKLDRRMLARGVALVTLGVLVVTFAFAQRIVANVD